jgi:hypothetical protein
MKSPAKRGWKRIFEFFCKRKKEPESTGLEKVAPALI